MFFSFVVDVSNFGVMYVVNNMKLLTSTVNWSGIMCRYVVSRYRWEFKRYKNSMKFSNVVQVGIQKK